ncbi:hypothetical protein JN11_03044 [Mucilaginibacter frigoritolerans]|uniref:Uncharacterized protein n=1 Tax=Mucilaginibacter frigoritolerans TaxID=652788 RepID=A0A562TZ14_9SPHI|nr:hypothetical protein [Mucilaginibacter frigoritolerans]TWI98855.1 hypothetical protein JN11_03044 [Mucilaginibacter frigoritolerans]
MKVKKNTVIILAAMVLGPICYDICKDIYHNGVKDGMDNAHKNVAVKK